MTMHPYIGSQNSRERQREMMAQAERRRLERQLRDLARASRRAEAYIAVAGEVRPGGRASMLDVPAAELAVAVHRGALADLDQTYGALGTYVARREIGADGPIRENYLVTEFDTDDESRHVTEVCWPVSGTAPPP
jgi:effector-binding domain-containing protein